MKGACSQAEFMEKKASSLIFLLQCFFATLMFAAARRVPATNITTDEEALLAFKHRITSDPQNLLATNWSTSTSVCNWAGVTCGSRHRRVTRLILLDMGLTGTIPPHLGNLSFLVMIALYNNSFHGSLPNELAHLSRMKYFSFAYNHFSGEIPSWIGSFTKLQLLALQHNDFTGAIPTSLWNLSNLGGIDLSSNSLEGRIPEAISNLNNLNTLRLAENKFSGPIPFGIFNLSSLQVIVIAANNLTGHLPNMFSHLPNLETLSLSWNLFYGPIPSTLFGCKQLSRLSLSNNHFEGSIPSDIGNSTRLQKLYLGVNNFNGTEIPTSISNLRSLEILSLTESGLTGLIPSNIGNLTSLQTLDLSFNGFTGTIPSEIASLTNLDALSIAYNSVDGLVPSGIYNASRLTMLALAANHLSGHLPSGFGLHLPNLENLFIQSNEFSGPVPASLSNASKLTMLDLAGNSFSGLFPDAFGNLRNVEVLNLQSNHFTGKSVSSELSIFSSLSNCKKLRALYVSDNPLNGTLPISLGNLSSSLESFEASNCGITGTIPKEIGNLSGLLGLNLEKNGLRGTIPPTIEKLQNLQGLYLQNNRLQGSLPFRLCNLRKLAYLDVGRNELFGLIPSCLGNVTSLRNLFMGNNKFTSVLPSTLWGLQDILQLNLSSNSLNGSLPPEISNLKAVTLIDFSRNQLSGDIPSTFGGLKSLVSLSLSKNKLEGSIPQSFGDMISLEVLDLSNNSLSGEIPKSLEKLLYLKSFNVSFNELQGEIPSGGSFTNFSSQSFMGNKGLCGTSKMQLQSCKTTRHRKSNHALRYIMVAIGSTILALALVIVFVRHRKRNMRLPTQGPLLPLATLTRISIQELKHATDNFNEINLIGRGGFGSVYKGTLQNGMIIAVKVFDLQVERAFKSFDVECEVLRRIRHRNLVKTITSCSNIDFKALVLEFMPKGSLEKWLYSHNHFLTILQRLNIMIDVASALEYLHYGGTTPVIHRDLKPTNILLDEDMVAHVSDFGLAKLLAEDHSVIQTMTIATVGYMAPEFGSEGLVSVKGDIYSYGILLMEIFARKKPTDEIFTEERSLKQWVKMSLSCGVDQIADANLLRLGEQHFSAKMECVTSTMELALKCCEDLPEERLDIKDVLSTLEKIKVKFLADIRHN